MKTYGYPVEDSLPALQAALADHPCAVLEAPTGAGKTTLVPLALYQQDWLKGRKIIMLEPRRLAARMVALRMADLLGEPIGKTVGYRVRQDQKISKDTRIEVVTEGILTRKIQQDPELSDVGLVIFDEFHERSLQADLGLALCRETQGALRDDLRLLVMSATLDGQGLSHFLDNCPLVRSEGRSYEVAVRSAPRPTPHDLPAAMSQTIQQALREESGSLLAFLPGESEIRRTQQQLETAYKDQESIIIAPLYGALPAKDQQTALRPAPTGTRKIVLATPIAETSLTIEGIRLVVDSGLKRSPRFDPNKGMTTLLTQRISQSAALQRKGRAGRLETGVCYQLWPAAETTAMAARDEPEILNTDLAPFLLETAAWGCGDLQELALLDYPSPALVDGARALLQDLGALDAHNRITAHGRAILAFGLHPRLGHMILKAQDLSAEDCSLACDLAAALSDGPLIKKAHSADLGLQLAALQDKGKSSAAQKRARQTAQQLKKRLKISTLPSAAIGLVLSFAFPERIAQRRGQQGVDYRLRNGRGARLREDDPLAGQEYLALAELGGQQAHATIFSAAPLSRTDLDAFYQEAYQTQDVIQWDNKTERLNAEQQTQLGALILSRKPLKNISLDQMSAALCQAVQQKGLNILPWDQDTSTLCQRVTFLRHHSTEEWPAMDEASLLRSADQWLAPFLTGFTKFSDLKKVDLKAALESRIGWDRLAILAEQAPTHYRVPSGSNIRLDYQNPKQPILPVKLQEMFGTPKTPTLCQGHVPVLIHLLSPAGRPLQITNNLARFWDNAYHEVKKEMRGRYPKHPWPDDPIAAIASSKTKKRLQ